MPPEVIDPSLELFKVGMMLLSIVACANVISMRQRGCVLTYEPRRPVPWGPLGCFLAFLPLVIIGLQFIHSGTSDDDTSKAISAFGLMGSMVLQLLIVLGFALVVAYISKATIRDLGLASNNRERIRDMLIGAAACLAALAPVHLTQLLMMSLFFPEMMTPGQPIIRSMLAEPDFKMLVVAGIATIVLAPVCEEITFRLLLQGWLERWEDDQLGWRKSAAEPSVVESDKQNVGVTAEGIHADPLAVTTSDLYPMASLTEPLPPQKGVFGLSYGWFPIVISAAVFGIVHYGYGPEPVPIFLLGLVLGYLYQRTHRILPGIVAHSLFNLFTMFILWRMMYFHS